MFVYWTLIGIYAAGPWIALRYVDAKCMGGPFRLGSVRTLAILVGIVACDAALLIRNFPRSNPDILTFFALDLMIIAATFGVAAQARLTVADALALSWFLSAATGVMTLALMDF